MRTMHHRGNNRQVVGTATTPAAGGGEEEEEEEQEEEEEVDSKQTIWTIMRDLSSKLKQVAAFVFVLILVVRRAVRVRYVFYRVFKLFNFQRKAVMI